MIKYFIPLLLLFFTLSCTEKAETVKKQSGEVQSSISAGSESDKELQAALKKTKDAEEAKLAKERSVSTTLEFDKLKHDYGTVLPDTDNKTFFTVTNTGERPLIIDNVSASCGCTMPKKPEGPISPGESDVIEVVFHPNSGQKNEIIKSITVTANTEEKIHLLEIRAFVKE